MKKRSSRSKSPKPRPLKKNLESPLPEVISPSTTAGTPQEEPAALNKKEAPVPPLLQRSVTLPPTTTTNVPLSPPTPPPVFGWSSWSYYDSHGAGPIERFLRADNGKSPMPTFRVVVMMLIGMALSSITIWLSEDEFFIGIPSKETFDHDFPVHIDFHNVGCHISSIGKDVLYNSTGSIPSGMLTGILGQSGSGKTVLCSFLLGRGRKHCSPAMGTVSLNGKDTRSLEAFLDRVGYVPQDDVLYADLTVEETLLFSAGWRLPRFVSEEERFQVVNSTIHTLDLHRVRHARIGNLWSRGLSGGERRRVSIGMELVAKPSVVIADEPTTGLDGASAYKLMRTLRTIVEERNGSVSIVAVVHQPSARVFDLLQHVILMAHGTVVFSGSPHDVLTFLANNGYVYQGPDHDRFTRSIPEFILDVLSGEETSTASEAWPHPFFAPVTFPKQVPTEEAMKVPQGLYGRFLYHIGFLAYCETDPGTLCVLIANIRPTEVTLPKPGFVRQLHMWFWTLQKIQWRKGFELQALVVFLLATTVAFVRSFNNGWSRRPHANFLLTLCISLLGTFGAIFTDDIAPVQRAAQSGMILAAHEMSCLAADIFLGWMLCHWFTLNYFTFLWLRNEVFCSSPYRFDKHYEFAHILHLVYLVSSGVGKCICAVTQHNLTASFVLAIGLIMHFHVFALFSPSKNQTLKDGCIFFNRINIAPIVLFFAKWSYVAYASEALMLWEPDVDSDRVGRNFTLRYFSWDDSHFSKCLTWMFALWVFSQMFRFFLFLLSNMNAYNSAYDIPQFLVFLFKVTALHVTTLIMMTIVQEFYASWKLSKNKV